MTEEQKKEELVLDQKQEEQKPEEQKQEEQKQEEQKQEEPKPEEQKQEEPKPEEQKQEEQKQEEQKPEEQKPEEQKQEEQKQEEQKPEEQKPEEQKQEGQEPKPDEGEYLNGKRNGKGKEYYENGNIKFEGEYLNGKKSEGIGYDIKGNEVLSSLAFFNMIISNNEREIIKSMNLLNASDYFLYSIQKDSSIKKLYPFITEYINKVEKGIEYEK